MKKLILLFLSFCYFVLLSSFTPVENCCNLIEQEQNCLMTSFTGAEENSINDYLLEESFSKEKELGCCSSEQNVSLLDDALVSNPRELLWHKNLPSRIGSKFILTQRSTYGLEPTPVLSRSKIPIQGSPLYLLYSVYRI